MIGKRRHLVTFQEPGPVVPDGAGGYTQTWADLPPTWYVEIQSQPVGDVERTSAGGSIQSTPSFVVRGRYHAGVSTRTRMLFNGKTYSITGTKNVDERGIDMELAAVEQVTP